MNIYRVVLHGGAEFSYFVPENGERNVHHYTTYVEALREANSYSVVWGSIEYGFSIKRFKVSPANVVRFFNNGGEFTFDNVAEEVKDLTPTEKVIQKAFDDTGRVPVSSGVHAGSGEAIF